MHLPIPPRTLAPALELAYRGLRRSVRWHVEDPWGALSDPGPRILACRHGQLLGALWAMEGRELSVLVSRSGDGDLLSAILHRRGFGVIRGSTTRAGFAAARTALRTLRAGHDLGLAADGPRGPWGQVQAGVPRLAAAADATIVPLTVVGADPWVAPGSWDRFEVPRPLGRLQVLVGAPLRVPPTPDGVATCGRELARALGGSWVAPGSAAPPAPSPSYGHP